MPHSKKSIFISYAREDGTPLAERLSAVFEARGYNVFLDVTTIPPGSSWLLEIQKAILSASCFISILTPKSITSRYFNDEWQIAYNSNIQIIPLKYIECRVEGFLAIRQSIDFREASHDEESVAKLIHRIEETDTTAPQAKPPPKSTGWRAQPIHLFGIHHPRQKVECITRDMPPEEAFAKLDLARYRFRHLLVTASGKPDSRLIGLVGLRQLLKVRFAPHLFHADTVADIMDRYDQGMMEAPTAAWIYENDTLETALHTFISPVDKGAGTEHLYYMSAIPLIDEQGNGVGIVSFKDLLNVIYQGKLIPSPQGTVGDWMRPLERVYRATSKEKVLVAKDGMRPLGQRDLPVLDEERFTGLVPDHKLIANYETKKPVGHPDVIAPPGKLKLQTPDTPLADLLPIYVQSDYAKMYYSFPVVERSDPNNPGAFLGLVGYREIFRAVLEQG